MQQQALRVTISRDGSDANHEELRKMHGVILQDPHVGDSVKIYFDDGKYMITSKVKRVAHAGKELIVETANSTYRLLPDSN